jgi:NAD(P)-dependent dehydrogenase (short-subunit alcohol dehydrogenase family)
MMAMHTSVAIITGAGGGIGAASVIELAALGYQIVLTGRSEASLKKSAAAIDPKQVLMIPADITVPADVARLVELTIARWGRIDLLVNNAGIAPMLGIGECSNEQFHAVIDTNLSAVFYLCKAVWPIFREQKGGVIVNISSLAARDPFPGLGIYGTAKAGLNMLGLSLAREGATAGIRVHTIAPGAVETSLLRSLFSQEQLPGEHAMNPKDVARVVAQCAAGDLKHTSGEVIWMHK